MDRRFFYLCENDTKFDRKQKKKQLWNYMTNNNFLVKIIIPFSSLLFSMEIFELAPRLTGQVRMNSTYPSALAVTVWYDVILKDIAPQALTEAPHTIRRNIRNYKMMSSVLQDWNTPDILSRITFTDRYDGFERASWVIENATEDWKVKSALYKELCEVCPPDAIFAVNTSCISITRLAALMPRPERVIGMHFMNPVPLKEAVETVRGFHTSEEKRNGARATG